VRAPVGGSALGPDSHHRHPIAMVRKSAIIAYPLLGICAGQVPDESGQHGGVDPNFPPYSR